MFKPIQRVLWIAICFALPCVSAAVPPPAQVSPHHGLNRLKSPPPPPSLWQQRPPSEFQARYRLPNRRELIGKPARPLRAMAVTAQCQDMAVLTRLSAPALAEYLVSLPDSACTYGLFSLPASQAALVYSSGNLDMVAQRFAIEGLSYNASNQALINLALYLRAGYYLSAMGSLSVLDETLKTRLRSVIRPLMAGTLLFAANAQESSSGAEVIRLISNMHDEAYYLEQMQAQVLRYTISAAQPGAAQALRETSASQSFTALLTLYYYLHFRPDAVPLLQNDSRYSTALYQFVTANRAALLGTETSYQLGDATRESLRFLQYPAIYAGVKQQAVALLSTSQMTGPDSVLWLAAAAAVQSYDAEHCSDYGTCNLETRLADAVLTQAYSCSPSIRLRAQQMTTEQMQSSCALLQKEESYFHQMLQTRRQPVANDQNASLEVVVFDDYSNYTTYAGLIYGIRTDNGGMYEEGDPASSRNQARFIAHEASWLRPAFSVWNLEHEYVHYLDGRFDMYGDFALSTQQPTVWWIEGLAEYISLRNNNQAAIDAAKVANYRLSEIFNNTYAMSDYVPRAYRWGYMATRFMFEKHRPDVDAVLSRFRVGNYADYQRWMNQIGTRYDNEFAIWAQNASTAGQPPLPDEALPACTGNVPGRLGKNCSLKGLAASGASYATLLLPAGARNLKLWTQGGSGDVDLYLAQDRYPSATSYDQVSSSLGNQENIAVPNPQAGHWYYLTLKAKQPFAGVTLSASYD
jgi:microbial collagenase